MVAEKALFEGVDTFSGAMVGESRGGEWLESGRPTSTAFGAPLACAMLKSWRAQRVNCGFSSLVRALVL